MHSKCWVVVLAFAVLLGIAGAARAEEEKGKPPFPLHTVEGTGGVILVPTAYLVNPAERGVVGKPSVAAYYANLDKKNLSTFSVTETLYGRFELGYAYNNLHLGDLNRELTAIGAADIRTHHVAMHNFNLRALLIRENAFDSGCMPAVTAGVHYKHNEDIDSIDRQLGGTLDAIGVEDENGWDFTLVGTKTIANPLPRPVILSLGGRLTRGNQLGLFGFTDYYKPMLEASAVALLTDRLAFAAEYRMKPDELEEISGCVEEEDDWWDVGLVYFFNENCSLTAGYVNYGNVLNNEVNGGFITSLKWEF